MRLGPEGPLFPGRARARGLELLDHPAPVGVGPDAGGAAVERDAPPGVLELEDEGHLALEGRIRERRPGLVGGVKALAESQASPPRAGAQADEGVELEPD